MPTTRPVSALPSGTVINRLLEVLTKSHGSLTFAAEIANGDDFRTVPQVRHTFDALSTKSAISPGTSTDALWASALVTSGVAAEAIALLRDISIVSQLEGRCRRIPFNLRVPKDDSALSLGGWAAEGAPIPVAPLSFSSVGPVPTNKVGVIIALTRELVEATDPAAQASVRRSVLGGLAYLIDQSFLLPTSVAASGRPGAITSAGATAITSTGTTAAQIGADLAAMRAAISTNGSGLTWIMRKKTMSTIAAALGSNSGLPQTLQGLPIITSDNSPAQITLADCAAILIADDGQFAVSESREASLQMDSAPMHPPDGTVVYRSCLPGERNRHQGAALDFVAASRGDLGQLHDRDVLR